VFNTSPLSPPSKGGDGAHNPANLFNPKNPGSKPILFPLHTLSHSMNTDSQVHHSLLREW
jgi:hypothetical protein